MMVGMEFDIKSEVSQGAGSEGAYQTLPIIRGARGGGEVRARLAIQGTQGFQRSQHTPQQSQRLAAYLEWCCPTGCFDYLPSVIPC